MVPAPLFFILFILYVILIAVFFKYDPTNVSKNYQGVSIFLTLLGGSLIIMLGVLSYQNNPLFRWSDLSFSSPPPGMARLGAQRPIIVSLTSFLFWFVIAAIVISVIVAIIFMVVYATGGTSVVGSGILTSLNVLFALAIITLLVVQLGKMKDNSIFALIYNTITYIPCLIVDLINAIKKEYNNTTPTTIIVLGINVALYFIIWILPKINKFIFDVPGQQLINEPIYINNEKVLGTYESFKSSKNKKHKFNYNYGISSWIYINPQPPNTGESYTQFTSLLNYGNKPNILYKADTNTLQINVKINDNNEKIIFSTNNFPLQKWNNIIVNYDGGTLDVFINNKLVASQGSVVPYMTFDKITSGSNNGIHGGICNVKYYPKKLNIGEIKQIFNSVKNKNPPIFSLTPTL